MSRLIVDTSVIIDFLRQKDKKNTPFFLLANEELSISIVTHTELFGGKSVWESVKVRNAVSEVLGNLTIINLNEIISEKAGFIKAHNQSRSIIDSIIAATAIIQNLELATLNIKDFEKIKDLKVYNLS